MKCFSWKIEGSDTLGNILRPVAEIAVKYVEGNWKYISVYVDSGADISVFQHSFGELLGLNIEEGRYAKFGGVGGGEVETYIHEVTLKVGDDILKADAAFCKNPADRVPNLIGRRSIFDIFEIRFKNIDKETCFVRSSTE
ncbi:MAG: hypothetical protein A7316_04940 [Candidatus Altiarchaeales archaeon WOR_SM1_86-2]|nr:MAG: hypothetical protein A7316_04940 [Candidatus Altiarchaeales archaeon WOR_SM1_86-2]